jgi:hypothetical protein
MENRFLGQDFHQPLFEGLQGLVLLLACALQGGFTDGKAEHLLRHFADAAAGSLLGVVEVSEQGAKVLPVLDGGFDIGWEFGPAGSPADGALFDFGPMLGAFQAQRGQVEDLTTLKIQGRFPGKVLAAPTLPQGMNPDMLGLFTRLECAAGVPGLTAGGAPGLFSEALGLGFFRPVRGRGARTVAAILGGGVPQAVDLLLQPQGVVDQPLQVGLAPVP